MAHGTARGNKLSSISRSLNTIRACLNHARKHNADLVNYRVPEKPLKKKVADIPRERVLELDEIKNCQTHSKKIFHDPNTEMLMIFSESPWELRRAWRKY